MSRENTRVWRLGSGLLVVGMAFTVNSVRADPLPGEFPKFQQLPLNGFTGAPFPGHD